VAWTSVGVVRPSLFNRSTSKGGEIEIHVLSMFSLSQLALASNYMLVEHEEGSRILDDHFVYFYHILKIYLFKLN
jgi:hypothetical protein